MNLLTSERTVPVTIGQRGSNPFRSLQRELNKTFGDFYTQLVEPISFSTECFENLTLSPAIDIIDNKNELKVEVEMPGMGEEDVSVNIDNGMLVIRGEKTTSKKDNNKNYMMREIGYGNYLRTISLPIDTLDINKAKASFKKGMLWVTLPKKDGAIAQKRQIKIEAA